MPKNDQIDGSELLELVSVHELVKKNRPLPQWMQKRGPTPAQRELWHAIRMWDAMTLQDRIMALGMNSEDPKLLRIAHEAAVDIKDRTMGKPTEKVQVAHAVRVIVGGLDLGRLPDPEPKDAAVLPIAPPEKPD